MIDLKARRVYLPGTDEYLRITTLHPVWDKMSLSDVEFEVDYSPLTDERLARFARPLAVRGFSAQRSIGVSDLNINDILTLAPRALVKGKKTGLLIHYGLVRDDTQGCLLVVEPLPSQIRRIGTQLGIDPDVVEAILKIRDLDGRFQSKRLLTNLALVSSFY